MHTNRHALLRHIHHLALCATWATFVHVDPALACGGGGITSAAGVVIDAQYVVISAREAGTTDIVVQVNVPHANSDFGLLIPVPSEPTLDQEPIPASELAALDDATAPEIVIDEGESDGPLIGCGSSKSAGDGAVPRVSAGAFIEIGPIVAVALKGDSATAVTTWLDENGFVLPTADTETLERYVSTGSYFIAVKRNDKPSDGSASSIGLHYSLQGDHRTLSLGFAKIGADAQIGFTLFLATKATTGPSAPFKALTLRDLDASLLKQSYDDAVRKAVADNDSKAFVLESATLAADLRPMLPTLSGLLDNDAIITRATTVVERDQLTTDAAFATPFTDNIPTSRRLSLAPSKRQPQAPWFGLVMFGALLSFPFRRRNT